MIETGGWGGIAHYAWNLCQALAEERTDVVLLTNARYELAALPSAFRVEPCFDEANGYLRTAGALLRRLSALGPDIVHVQSLLSTRFDALLWPLVRRRRPMVMTAHNVRGHERARWESWTVWRCIRAADAVIVHTEESAQVAAARLRPGAQVRVIRHGDYGFFASESVPGRQEARRLLDLPENARVLLAFGAIRPYKGILELIGALPRIRIRQPDVHLVIVGPLLVGTEGEYRAAIRKAGVEAAVAFRPQYVPHERVAPYFAAADVAVYNYRDVTDSGSLRIACSLGTPVVATSVGGFREFLTDGVTGRLVPPGAPELLVEAISDVLDDPATAARMAAAARALAASRWSWADSAAATLALYAELLGAKPSALRAPGQARDDSMRSRPDRKPGGTHAG
jgi:glycosyltransferase involved in cell wall biosynthesis